MPKETPLTTGYRVGQALLCGLLLCLAAGCGSLWQGTRPGVQAAYGPPNTVLAVIQPTRAVPARPTPSAPTGPIGVALTPVIRVEPTPTPTAVPTLKPTPEDTAFSLLILHTNDTRGYVDPCG